MTLICRTDRPLLSNPTKWTRNFKKSSLAGKWILFNDDKSVVSIQPNGNVDTRPEGTDGPFEQFDLIGDKFVSANEGCVAPAVYGVVVVP